MNMATIYLVKKNAHSRKNNTEWIELSAKEFFDFLKTDSAKNRYFIRLQDDYPGNANPIVIEASRSDYLKWKKEHDHQRYLDKQRAAVKTISLEAMTDADYENEPSLISRHGLPEKEVIRECTLRDIAEAVSKLSKRDRVIFEELFDEYGEPRCTLTDFAQKYGLTLPYASLLRKRMFLHLRDILGGENYFL